MVNKSKLDYLGPSRLIKSIEGSVEDFEEPLRVLEDSFSPIVVFFVQTDLLIRASTLKFIPKYRISSPFCKIFIAKWNA